MAQQQIELPNVGHDWPLGLLHMPGTVLISWVPLHDPSYRDLMFVETLPLQYHQKVRGLESNPQVFAQVVGNLTSEVTGYLVMVYPDQFNIGNRWPKSAALTDKHDIMMAWEDLQPAPNNPRLYVAHIPREAVVIGDYYDLTVVYNS